MAGDAKPAPALATTTDMPKTVTLVVSAIPTLPDTAVIPAIAVTARGWGAAKTNAIAAAMQYITDAPEESIPSTVAVIGNSSANDGKNSPYPRRTRPYVAPIRAVAETANEISNDARGAAPEQELLLQAL